MNNEEQWTIYSPKTGCSKLCIFRDGEIMIKEKVEMRDRKDT